MRTRRLSSFAVLPLTIAWFAGCAEGETIAESDGDQFSAGGSGFGSGGLSGAGGFTSTGSGPATSGGAGTGGTTGTGGVTGAGGATGSGGGSVSPDGGPGTPPDGGASDAGACQDPTQKFCLGICIDPGPAIGCEETGCDPCPSTANGFAVCDATSGACALDCLSGYTLSGNACVPVGGSGGATGAGGAGGATGAGGAATCTPLTCANYPGQCGIRDNGCGANIDCSASCGGSDVCAAGACCAPLSCGAYTGQCGTRSNGCGANINCDSNCTGGDVCNAGSCCAPVTCSAYPGQCGTHSNGCGGNLDCSTSCPGGQVCNAGSCCTPLTACPSSAECGVVPDGCGGASVQCGTCTGGQNCVQNQCVDIVGFRKLLTIQGSEVPSAQSDFPVLVRITDAQLQAGADASGRDIYFTQSDGMTPLPFERESYDTGTGALAAWVKLNLTGDDQGFFIYYGGGDLTERSTPGSVWTNQFRAVYHLNGAATGSQADSSGNNNNAAPDTQNCSGSCTPAAQAAGIIGSALTFGATASTRLIAADSSSLDITGQITVSAWVRLTTASYAQPQTVLSKRIRTNETCNYQAGFWTNNNMLWMWGSGTEWPPVYASSPAAVPPQNQWAHVTWTIQGSPLGMRTYLNGVRINSTDQTASSNVGGAYPVGDRLQLNTNTQPLFIGGMDQETDQALIGDLDEVRIAATSRSVDWVNTEYNNQRPGSTFLSVGAQNNP